MKCNKCKTELVDDAKYCHKCGVVVLKRLTFISNGKKKKQTVNILVETLEDIKKEIDSLKNRIETVENRNNETTFIPQPLQPTMPNVQPLITDGTGTWPNGTVWYTTNNSDSITLSSSSGTESITLDNSDSNNTFYSNTSTELIVRTDGNVGI